MYTDTELNEMDLSQRVSLASEGKIPWSAVNRPEADAARRQREVESIYLGTRIRQAPLCRSAREVNRRRRLRASIYREERARVEYMLANGLNDNTLRLQEV